MGKKLNRDDIDKFHDVGLYLPTRTLYIGSEGVDESGEAGVDFEMAKVAIKNLHILDSINKDPITILMNNPGGNTYHGLSIYDAIKGCKSHVTIVVFGHAMSCGSIILQAADERVMAANAVQMIHYGSGSASGHSKTFEKLGQEEARLNQQMESIYLLKIKEKNPTFTLSKLKKLLDHDTFLTAQQSVELGLADRVKTEDTG